MNWLLSEDAFRYLLNLGNNSDDKTINIRQSLKRELSDLKAKTLFFTISFNFMILSIEIIKPFFDINEYFSSPLENYPDLMFPKNAWYLAGLFMVKLGVTVIFYCVIKKFSKEILLNGSSMGIPLVSELIQKYNEQIALDISKQLKNYTQSEIKSTLYYIDRFLIYKSVERSGSVYVYYDQNSLFSSYIKKKTYKKLSVDEKSKWIKVEIKYLQRQLDYLEETLNRYIAENFEGDAGPQSIHQKVDRCLSIFDSWRNKDSASINHNEGLIEGT